MAKKFLTKIDATAGVTAPFYEVSETGVVDVRKIVWNPIDGTFDMGLLNGVTLQAGQELHFFGKAVGSIGNGQAVMFAGVQGDHLLMTLADPTIINANPEYFIGIATQDFVNNDFGYVTILGSVRGLNTLSYTLGDILYFDSTSLTLGQLTPTRPEAPNAKIEVAAVVRVHGTQGILKVRPHVMPRVSDLQDVHAPLTSMSNDKTLGWSTNRWEARTIPSILGYTPVPDSRTITINGTTYDLTANRAWTITTDASARSILRYVATAGQTIFTISGGYTPGLTDVYRNGVKLDNETDFTATNGTTIVLTNSASANDVIEVYRYQTAFLANNALRTVTEFIATAGQTTFNVTYNSGLVDVFYNGSKLVSTEYTAGNGTSIVLNFPCNVNDTLEVHAYSYQVGAFSGQAQLNGTGFVKANGTTITYDNSTYLTTSAAASTYLTTSAAGTTYLPLSGGTLTGPLNGTSATFSVAMRSNGVEITNTANADILDIFQSPSALNSFIDYPSGKSLIIRNKGSLGGLTLDSNGAAIFSGDINSTSSGFQGRYARIYEASAQRGGFYTYNFISGSGTDYSVGLFSESSLWFAAGGGVTKHLTIASNGSATFSGVVNFGNDRNSFSRSSIRLTSVSNNASVLDINVSDTTTYINSNYFSGGNDNTLILGTYANYTNQLVLKPSGGVLVGTTTDQGHKFQVYGTSYFTGITTIGQTSPNGAVNGIYFRPGIESGFIVTNDVALQLSRLGTNGDIQTFYFGTTRVGKVVVADGVIKFESANNGGISVLANGNVSVGSITSNVYKLNVAGSIKSNRSIYNWYSGAWQGNGTYWHMKTTLWAGGSPYGNVAYTMSYFKGYSYSYSASILEGAVGFHNYSGYIYSYKTTGNIFSNVYVSSDGYVVIVVPSGQGETGITIDWHQHWDYPFIEAVVTAAGLHGSTSGKY